jgi:hypothetical protein
MKSRLDRVIFNVFEGLINDALRAFPELSESFLLDKERIARYYGERGLGLFTLDLPELDSLLLRGLESGRLCLEGPLSRAVSYKVRVPKLFSGLWLRIFHRDSSLKSDSDCNAILFLRQFTRLGKGLAMDCSKDRVKSTLEKYHAIEEALRRPTLEWSEDELSLDRTESLHLSDACSPSNFNPSVRDQPDLFMGLEGRPTGVQLRDREILTKLQQVADFFVDSLEECLPLHYSVQREKDNRGIGFKHGPGAVADRMDQGSKFSFPNWPAKLQAVFPFDQCGKMPNDQREQPRNHELPSRLICVPKSAKSPRLIAAEPVQHQWCQQLLWAWLRDQVDGGIFRHFLDFRRQNLSADMVLEASKSRKLATVDLSDASDRLTCWTVERVFRGKPSILRALHAARTRWIRDDISDPKGLFIKLNKFASQGTATTFPVQSIVFLIIAIASAIGDGKVDKKAVMALVGKVRVYGDDIIIPTYGYARLTRIMDLLQLKVNMAKCYVHGHFRESCGTDGFRGYDVTPTTPKVLVADGPASCQAVIDTSNNLFMKGFWHASRNLESSLPPRVKRGLRIVGFDDAGFLGLTSFCGSDEHHLVHRWNQRLHRDEVRIWRLSPKKEQRERGEYVSILDFASRPHNPRNPRVTGRIGCTWKTKAGFLWEPANTCSRALPS